MESGDGFIVRVEAGWRARPTADVRALARLAREFGNGQLELTRRGNWQLRGVSAAKVSPLQIALVGRGLAEPEGALLPSASLLVNPLSGIDPACAPLETMAETIERALSSPIAPRDLPDKFSIALDSGSGLRGVGADIRIDLCPSSPGTAYVSVEASRDRALFLGSCRANDVAAVLLALLDLASRGVQGARRMRDVIDLEGERAVRDVALPLLLDDRPPPLDPCAPQAILGFHRGLRDWVGLGLPFGSGDAGQWNAIADIAEQFGDGSLRLSPRRAVIVPGAGAADREAILTVARAADLVFDESDPRARITACVGAPYCSAARGETRRLGGELGSVLAPLLSAGGTLHVSGCSKSCAHGGAASVTVVCHERGYQVGRDRAALETSVSHVMALDETRTLLAAMAADFAQRGAARRS